MNLVIFLDESKKPSMGDRQWSLLGKVLKLNTAEDLEPYLASLRAHRSSIEEIIVSGNTFGVEAAKALAAEIKELKSLKVCPLKAVPCPPQAERLIFETSTTP